MSTPFVSVPNFPPLTTFIATYDIVNDLPQYFVLYEDDADFTTVGFFVYDSSAKHADTLLTTISATSGVGYSSGGVVSAVSAVSIVGMSIFDAVSANGNLYVLIEEGGRSNVWVLNYTTRQALRLQDPYHATLSPFCRSIASNGLMFGYALSAGYDPIGDRSYNYTVVGFYDLSGGNVKVEATYGSQPHMSKSGYGYYETGDETAGPLGGVYSNPKNTLKQAVYNNGTPIVKSLSAADAYSWNLLNNSNVTTHTAYVVKEWWTGSALSATLLAINEVAYTASTVFNFSPDSFGVQNVSKDGTKALMYSVPDGIMSLWDTTTLSSVDATEYVNSIYPRLDDVLVQDLFGNALIFSATFNGNSMTMAIDINSHVLYIGERTRDDFLRRRLLGYC